ncbi:MAG TPA: glycoside hydrolase family 95 protein [Ohtaekwangia sp.]|uniref:glycoside hydrolase family 95 protein n=1 Tax=Ohtaekwangia sp. TaxID=2066019 RepID=UPI002F9393DB
MRIFFLLFFALGTGLSAAYAQSPATSSPLRLWYQQPAEQWEASLPLGNGRLGAMPDGGIYRENIVLNDITLWSGSKQDADAPDAARFLPQIQQLLFEGKNAEAESLMYNSFVCKGAGSGLGNGSNVPYGSYEVLGSLHLDYHYGIDSARAKLTSYQRELSLDKAIASTQYILQGTSFKREYFTSFAHDVIVIRLTADQSKKIGFTVSLDRPERYSTTVVKDELQMTGQLNNGTDGKGMRYITRVKLVPTGGKVTATGNQLNLSDADAVTIYISSATDFRNPQFEKKSASELAAAIHEKYDAEKAAHIRNYQQLFNRTTVWLGNDERQVLPTDVRLQTFAADGRDPGLAVLYFQYGRYLLISSTRPGLLPPNLQGLWANTIHTPWNGDYHLNINIQMNHWPLHVGNLPMLNEPFYTLVQGLVEPGSKTAKIYYNADGWVAHVITNVWGYTSPGEHPSWGAFNTGSAWLCQMLWDHYTFTQDKSYLEKLYPILKGSALFYLSTLVNDPATGWLVTSPSNSPENSFRLPDGKTANVCMGPTMDNQILRALFNYTIEASTILGKDEPFRQQMQTAVQKLPPTRIGKDGRVMEWLQEYEEVDPHHRHISHLWGLYPAEEITIENTPALATAAKKTLDGRGDGGTGWSLAWKVNLWARLHDGNHAYTLLKNLLYPIKQTGIDMHNGGGTYTNLFCGHPPFQIDGNFGGAAGIAEMLLQSHQGYIEFLPALPDVWNTGSYTGLCVRGGAQVAATWKEKKMQRAEITATVDHEFKIRIPSYSTKPQLIQKGKTMDLAVAKSIATIRVRKGEQVVLLFN